VSWAARCAQLGWLLDHQDDLDADFLAVYGIDLEQRDIGSRRYVQLAQRLAAFPGVIAARIAAEQQDGPAPRPAAAAAQTGGREEVDLMAFRLQFPGVVSMTRVTE